MSKHLVTGFIGVISPNGELEAVESTETDAEFARVHLSPNKKQPNRKLEPVLILRGELSDLMLEFATKELGKRFAEFEKAEKDCTTIDNKSGKPVIMATADYITARERLRTAARLQSALT